MKYHWLFVSLLRFNAEVTLTLFKRKLHKLIWCEREKVAENFFYSRSAFSGIEEVASLRAKHLTKLRRKKIIFSVVLVWARKGRARYRWCLFSRVKFLHYSQCFFFVPLINDARCKKMWAWRLGANLNSPTHKIFILFIFFSSNVLSWTIVRLTMQTLFMLSHALTQLHHRSQRVLHKYWSMLWFIHCQISTIDCSGQLPISLLTKGSTFRWNFAARLFFSLLFFSTWVMVIYVG